MARDPQAAAIAARLRAEIARATATLTLEVTANLIEACPVDTGHARRNFVPTVGAPHQGEDGGAAQQTGMAQVAAYQLGQGALHITNNVPYINRLLAGSSAQAPPGWDLEAVDRAVQTVQQRYDTLDLDVTVGGAGASVQIGPRE